MNSKDVAEITTRIVLAAIQSGKFSCESNSIVSLYKAVHEQVLNSYDYAEQSINSLASRILKQYPDNIG